MPFHARLLHLLGILALAVASANAAITPTQTSITGLGNGTVSLVYPPQTGTSPNPNIKFSSNNTTASENKIWSATSVPPGLTFNPSGILSGKPSKAGNFTMNLSVRVGKQVRDTGSRTIVVVDTLPPIITPSTLPGGKLDNPYQANTPNNGFKLSGTGGTPFGPNSQYPTGYYWQLIPGKLASQRLPQGMTLNPNGVISGTPVWSKPPVPSTSQAYTLQVRATDFLGKSATANFTLVIAPPQGPEIITDCPLPSGLEKYPYPVVQLKARYGKESYSWPKPAGLPPGLVWNERGYISGTPTTRGTYPIVIKVVDANGLSANKTCEIVIRPAPELDCPNIPCARVGDTLVPVKLPVIGGDLPYTYNATGLPPSITINSNTGFISGNFTGGGNLTYNATFTVRDAAGRTANKTCPIVVRNQLEITTASPLPFGIKGSAYPGKTGSPTVTINATGGWPPYTRQRLIGILPPGLTLNTATGTITGTPTQIGNYKFTIRVYDSCKPPEKFLDKEFEITIYDPLEIVDTSILQCNTINKTISPPFCLTAKGGRSTYSWSINSGSLPAGLTLNNSTGCISGTITSGGNFSVTIQVKDQNEIETLKSFDFRVYDELVITSSCPLAFGTNGTAYSANLTATGGNAPYTWSVPSPSTLPIGLAINSTTGRISGTPRVTGNFSFDYRVTDSCGNTATKNCSMRIFEPLKIIDTNILSCYTVNKTISPAFCLTVTGGLPGYEWSIQSGNLPTGLSFSSNGCISGTITQSGNFTVTAKVKDQNGTETQKIFSFVVYDELIITSSCPLAFGTNGTFYSANLSATGGNAPYSWSVPFPSTLPTGLAINSTTGRISGTPKIAENYIFAYKVVDACGNNATANCSISFYEPLKITTNNLFSCVWVGDDSECFQVQATGGAPAYTWNATNLPATLTINASNGKICGNFTQSGNFTSTIRVTDQNGSTSEKIFTTEVNPELTITTSCPLPDGIVDQSYSTTLNAIGGKPPYTWQILPQIYVADFSNHKIRKFNENGVLKTYAGSGVDGSINGTLLTASFNKPYGMAFDPEGNIYVADYGSSKIRKISASGNVTTIAPDDSFDSPEDMVVDEVGNVFVSCTTSNKIKKVSPTGSVSDFSSDQINGPQGVAWDLSGNIILGNYYANNILSINPSGNSTILGSISTPHDVKVHHDGSIFIAALGINKIIKLINGIQSTFADCPNPANLSLDQNGFVYVADSGSHVIYKIPPQGGNVFLKPENYIIAGSIGSGNSPSSNQTITPLEAKFSDPRGVEINPYEDLPLGLTLNATTGVISGTPKANGLYNLTYQVTDSCGNKVISNCSMEISSNKPEFDFELPWKFTDEGAIASGHNGSLRNYTSTSMPAGALWSVSADNLTLKVSWENSANCIGGNNSNNQLATATIYMTTTKTQKIGLNWVGIGELQASIYDKMQVYIDEVLIGSANAAGGGQGCKMGSVVSVSNYPAGYNLPAGNHNITIEATTADGLYHTGSFYQFTFKLIE